jgi:predicted Fe-Mo cluster-binding NifX family protein
MLPALFLARCKRCRFGFINQGVRMKIAIPTKDGAFNAHFGQSTAFWICDVLGDPPTITQSHELQVPANGGCGAIPLVLSQAGVELVLAGGMGAGALQNLKRVGIEALTGVAGGTPEQIVLDHLAGKLDRTNQLCQQHGHGHHGHGHQGHGHHHGHGHGGCCHTSGSK